MPKHKRAEDALKMLEYTIKLIYSLEPKYIFIENPCGAMRKQDIMQQFNINRVTYCQYGDTRMKPTDIFTNTDIMLKPACHKGDSCHESAPRGSHTSGTQALPLLDRSKVPPQLCEDIIKYCEEKEHL